MGSETTTGPEEKRGPDDCVVLEQEFVSTEIEPEGDTTASIRLAEARRGRGARPEEKSPTTGELTASDLRWFGRKAAPAAVAPPVGESAMTYV